MENEPKNTNNIIKGVVGAGVLAATLGAGDALAENDANHNTVEGNTIQNLDTEAVEGIKFTEMITQIGQSMLKKFEKEFSAIGVTDIQILRQSEAQLTVHMINEKEETVKYTKITVDPTIIKNKYALEALISASISNALK